MNHKKSPPRVKLWHPRPVDGLGDEVEGVIRGVRGHAVDSEDGAGALGDGGAEAGLALEELGGEP